MKKKILTIGLLMVFSDALFAQELPTIFPPSPEASNLGVYAEIPVGYDTGVPNIDIPIWNISVGNSFNLPISLSYHASGIKTNQDASWVGLGWVLNAGGVITTTTVGQPDLPLRVTDNPEFANDLSFPPSHQLIVDLLPDEGGYIEKDLQPDIFHYNFNGFSGKFLLKEDGTPILFPLNNLKIERIELIEGWKITTDTGIIYSFKEIETTNNNVTKVYYQGAAGSSIPPPSESMSAIYLSEIELPTKQKIYFNYQIEKYQIKHPDQISKEYNKRHGHLETHSVNESISYVSGKHLSSIVWDDGRIEFETKDRYDFMIWDTNPEIPQRLSKIKIFDAINTEPIRIFELDQEYFNPCTTCTPEEKAEMARLKLKGLKECDDQGNCKPPYTFLYDETNPLPSKQKGSRDHWGYMNSTYNSTNLPSFIEYGITGFSSTEPSYFDATVYDSWFSTVTNSTVEKWYDIISINRSPSFPEMRLGSLLEIKYPTGGSTVFDLEAHEFSSNTLDKPVRFYENIYESIDINGTTSTNYVTKNMVSEKPVIFNFSMQIDPSNCHDYSCSPTPCLKYDCFDLYGENRIWVVDNNSGLPIIYIEYDEYEDIGNGEPFMYSSPYGNVELGINVTNDHEELLIEDVTLPPGDYSLHVQRDFDNEGQVHASLGSYTITEHDSNLDPLALMAGGLRIKKKTDFDNNNIKIKEFSYEYGKGVIYNQPSYYNLHNTHNISLEYVDHNPWGPSEFICRVGALEGDIGYYQGDKNKVEINSGNSNVLTSGHISYEEITVSEINNVTSNAENGYSVYSFSQKTSFPISSHIESWSLGDFSCDNDANNRERLYSSSSGNINKPYSAIYEGSAVLDLVKIYSSNNILQRSESYNYDYFNAFDFNNADDYLVHGLNVYPIPLDFGSTEMPNNQWQQCSFSPCQNAYEYKLMDFYGYDYHTGYKRLQAKKITDYFNGIPVEKEYVYTYDNNKSMYPSEVIERLSDGLTKKTVYKYPEDVLAKPHMQDLIDENRVASPVVVEEYKGNTKLSEQETVYENDASTGNTTLPKFIFSNKGTASLDTDIPSEDLKITYDLYDDKGNILQYTIEGGVPVSIIWGYNQTYPIARIEQATYSQVSGQVTNIQNLSDADNDHCLNSESCDETTLRTALTTLRNTTANAMTTYTYNPQIGVTSMTDPKGNIFYYHYDGHNRLKYIKDANGEVLTESKYHYKE